MSKFNEGDTIEVFYSRNESDAVVEMTLSERPQTDLEMEMDKLEKFHWVEDKEGGN